MNASRTSALASVVFLFISGVSCSQGFPGNNIMSTLLLQQMMKTEAGISVMGPGALVTSESGGMDSFTVALTSPPKSSVTIAVSSSNVAEGTVTPTSLTFDSGNWNAPQTVTARGVDDVAVDGSVPYTIVLGSAASSDPAYNGLNPPDVSALNLDNESISGTPAIIVLPTTGLTTNESGATAQFLMILQSAPVSNVTINLSSSLPTEGTVSPSSVTFTTANWNVSQTVTVTGVDDTFTDGPSGYTIITAPAVSADPAYSGLNGPDVSVVNNDNDTAGITTSVPSVTVSETGTVASFTVVLASQPTTSVAVTVATGDATEAQVSSDGITFSNSVPLTFSAATWNNPQTITVRGVDDLFVDGNQIFSITLNPASVDAAYNALPDATVQVTTTDNEVPGVTVSPGSLTTSESGTSDSFTVVLTSQPAPAQTVKICLVSSDTTEAIVQVGGNVQAPDATCSQGFLLFTDVNWFTTQTVTVIGQDDVIADGAQNYSILLLPTISADPAFNGIDPADKTGSNNDSGETAGINVSTTSGLTVSETGTTTTFTVVLTSAPTAPENINVAASSAEVVVSSDGVTFGSTASVTFTLANWFVPKVISVRGVNDHLVDGDQSFSVALTTSGGDASYNAINPPDPTGTNKDMGVLISELTYTLAPFSAPFTSIDPGATQVPASGPLSFTPNLDDGRTLGQVPLGFTFNFLGGNYSAITITTNGYAHFGANTDTPDFFPPSLFNAGVPVLQLAPWRKDININLGGAVFFTTTGTPPNQVFTIEWKAVPQIGLPTEFYQFQLKLYETSNNIEFVYGPLFSCQAGGTAGAIGIKGPQGGVGDFIDGLTGSTTVGTTAFCVNVFGQANNGIRFSP